MISSGLHLHSQLSGSHICKERTENLLTMILLTLLYCTRHWPLAPRSSHLHWQVLVSNF